MRECSVCGKQYETTFGLVRYCDNGIHYACIGECYNRRNGNNNKDTKNKTNNMATLSVDAILFDTANEIEKINTCKCCYEEFEQEHSNALVCCSGITLKNKHKVCKECLTNYIKSNINPGSCSLECMFENSDGCGGTYPLSEIEALLSTDDYERFMDNYVITATLKMSNLIENYQICPFCSKYGIELEKMNFNYENRIPVKCGRCYETWCSHCYKNHGVSESCFTIRCDALNSDEIEKKISEIEKLILNTLDDAIIHKCPSCNTEYIKDDGCNKITCTVCGAVSCYLCGEKIEKRNETYYWHFSGNVFNDGKTYCKLYSDDDPLEGNAKYIYKSLKDKLMRLIENNEEQIAVIIQYVLRENKKYTMVDIEKIVDEMEIESELLYKDYLYKNKDKYPLLYGYVTSKNVEMKMKKDAKSLITRLLSYIFK